MTRYRGLCLLVLVGALALRLWNACSLLPADFYYEERWYVPIAYCMGDGDLNPHYFVNPSLFTYLLFGVDVAWYLVGRLLGVFRDAADFQALFHAYPTAFCTAARCLAAVCGSAGVGMAMLIARRLFGRPAAAVAGILLALAPLHASMSGWGLNDALAATVGLTASWLALKDRWTLAFLAAGLALGTKYAQSATVIGILVSAGWTHRDRRWLPPVLKGLLLVLAGFLLVNPYVVLDFAGFRAELSAGAGSETNPIWKIRPESSFFYYSRSLVAGASPAFFLLGGLGLVLAVRRSWMGRSLPLWFPAAWLMAVMYAHVPQNARYLLPAVAVLCIFAGGAAQDLWERVRLRPGAPLLALLFLPLLCAPALAQDLRHARMVHLKSTLEEAREWVEAHVPSGSVLLTDSYTGDFPSEAPTKALGPLHLRGYCMTPDREPLRSRIRARWKGRSYVLYQMYDHLGALPWQGIPRPAYLVTANWTSAWVRHSARAYPPSRGELEFYDRLFEEGRLLTVLSPEDSFLDETVWDDDLKFSAAVRTGFRRPGP